MVKKVEKKIETNWQKFRTELKLLARAVRVSHASHWSGAWPNKFVESARAAPYAVGHIDALYYPLSIAAIIALAVL
jgi:hypothetical protein